MWTPTLTELGPVNPAQAVNWTITYDDPILGSLPVTITASTPYELIVILENNISGQYDGTIFDQSTVEYLAKDEKTQVTLNNISDIEYSDVYGIYKFFPDPRSSVTYTYTATATLPGDTTTSQQYTVTVTRPSWSIDRDALLNALEQTKGR